MIPFSALLAEKKNFILIGETGSGKSEISLNLAVMLSSAAAGSVHLFDLDQTKAAFRARDAQEEMASLGVEVHYMPQLLDTPVMVNGIIPHLRRADSLCVLDVGGNENASRMVGCLSDYLTGDNSAALYVVNPFRPFSGTQEDMELTMAMILNACHIERIHFLLNPNIGPGTSEADVREGFAEAKCEACGAFVPEALAERVSDAFSGEIYPLHPYLIYPWNRENPY